jgi:flavin reductase (DIM6/NTAB) family NADH-FMN oxidoreductase RutF
LIGFILRPTTVPRDTYRNIKDTGVFTVNHINSDIIEDAHHTSAKYPDEVSEFTKTDLQEEFLGEFSAPFVKDAKIRLGCTFLNEYEIKENDTLLLVSQVDHLYVADQEILQTDGWLKLQNADTVTINGLDGYAKTALIDRYPYARPKKE